MPQFLPLIQNQTWQNGYNNSFVFASKTATNINNAGGTILGVSKASLQNTRITDVDFGWPYLGQHNQYNDNKPYLNTTVGNRDFVAKALSAGTFASMVQDKYVMMTYCSQLAGVANTLLNTPGFTQNPNSQNLAYQYRNTWKKRQGGGWYYQSGQPINAQYSSDHISNEVNTSYSKPGRITFNATGNTNSLTGNTTQNYQAKTD